MNKPIYYCCECKKILSHLDDLLFIDEFSFKGFCSEECIEDFYFPLIKYFEFFELKLREKLSITDESVHDFLDPNLIDNALTSPDEVYRNSNELQESYYTFIKKYNDVFVVIVASVYRKEASFVFLATSSRSQLFVNEFKNGKLVTNWITEQNEDLRTGYDDQVDYPTEENSDVYLSEEAENENAEDEDLIFMHLLESKKSKILAEKVLMKKLDSDIPFEDYIQYDFCFQETLDNPDEVFEEKDNEGDVIFSYIKSFSRSMDDNFYYIVICLKRKLDDANTNIYPILGIPTFEFELAQEFRSGVRLSGPLKN